MIGRIKVVERGSDSVGAEITQNLLGFFGDSLGAMDLRAGDGFVEIDEDAGEMGPGGELGLIEIGGSGGEA